MPISKVLSGFLPPLVLLKIFISGAMLNGRKMTSPVRSKITIEHLPSNPHSLVHISPERWPNFALKTIKGAGAYICGEETALLASIEGQRPEVRTRPPFPTVECLFRRPTIVNNVETFSNLHAILTLGGKGYAKIGTPLSTGPKLVSLDSHFAKPGIYEVAMGTPLKDVIEMAGGSVGIAGAFNKNVQYWLILGTVLGFLGTVLVSIPFIRSFLLPLLLIVPLILGTLAAVGIMIMFGIELNSNAAGALAIASGVGIDSEVYLLYRVREEYLKCGNFREALVQGFVKIRRALMVSNGALILGCWSLALIPLYSGYVGFGMGLVLLLCFVFSGVLSPIMWAWLGEKIVVGSVDPESGNGGALARPSH